MSDWEKYLSGFSDDRDALYYDARGLPAFKGAKVFMMGEFWTLIGFDKHQDGFIVVVNLNGDRYAFPIEELEKVSVNYEW